MNHFLYESTDFVLRWKLESFITPKILFLEKNILHTFLGIFLIYLFDHILFFDICCGFVVTGQFMY